MGDFLPFVAVLSRWYPAYHTLLCQHGNSKIACKTRMIRICEMNKNAWRISGPILYPLGMVTNTGV